MAKKNIYKVDFSIDNLSLVEQQKIFEAVIKKLDFNQRQDLHITVTDSVGGKHFIWDGYGIDPTGTKCINCKTIECDGCPVYIRRKELADGKNTDNAGNN